MKLLNGDKKAFSLIEVIIVVMIVGIASSFALIKYTSVIENMRSDEGRRILMAIYGAQKEYFRDTDGDYHKGNLAAINNDLDVTIPNAQHFDTIQTISNPGLDDGKKITVGACGTIYALGQVTRTGGDYDLYISREGEIYCTISSSSCSGICEKMGFPTTW